MWFRPAYPPKGPVPVPDLEVGPGVVVPPPPLYPAILIESPELRWAFIRKVYSIVSFQMLLTLVVGAVVVYHRSAAYFFVSGAGVGIYILTFLMPFLVLPFLYFYYQRYPWNMLLLGIFTASISFAIGLTCAFTPGKVILESVMLTAVVVISLTMYTFWAAKRGHDFNFLGPFLFAAIMILLVYGLIQLFLPMSRISLSIYGALASLIFCGYIIYDTDNLIKRYTYDEYIWAAVALYLDIINLFLALLMIFRAND